MAWLTKLLCGLVSPRRLVCHGRRALLSISCLIFIWTLPALQAKEAAVIITGEAHGALTPCVCPFEPDGGLARRSGLLRQLSARYPANIVVNVGGDAAGGPYDEDYGSPDEAAWRTAYIMQASGLMPLDAFVPGDEELAFGSPAVSSWAKALPFVALNCPAAGIKSIVQLERGGVRFAVTGVSKAPEWPLVQDKADLPEVVLPERIPQFFDGAPGITILVCHLGEEETIRVAKRLAAAGTPPSLIVNAHSRRDPRNVFFVDGIPVAQFPPLGRKVRVALFETGPHGTADGGTYARFLRLETIRLSPDVPSDPEVQEIVEKFGRERREKERRIRLTLFKMTDCKHTPPVEKRLLDVLPHISGVVEFRIRLLTAVDREGRLILPADERDLEESRVQAAVSRFYPDLLPQYLALRIKQPSAPWQDLAGQAGALPARIRGAVLTGEADNFLSWDRAVAARLGVRAGPVVVVENKAIDLPPVVDRSLSYVCSLLQEDGKPGICTSVPRCFSDADCRKPGKEGECIDPGAPKARCRYADAVHVPLVVLYPPNAVQPRRHDVIRALFEFFPGLEVDEVRYPSEKAEALLQDYPFDTLPAYFAGREIEQAKGFADVKSTLVRLKDGGFVFHPDAAGSSFYYKRPESKGSIKVYFPAGTEHGRQAISSLAEFLLNADVPLRPLVCPIVFEQEHELHAPAGRAALEEALRIIAVGDSDPGRLWDYLAALAEAGGTGYWEEPLARAGFDPETIKTASMSESTQAKAMAIAAECRSLGLPPRVALLFDNREVVLPADRGGFMDLIMGRLGR